MCQCVSAYVCVCLRVRMHVSIQVPPSVRSHASVCVNVHACICACAGVLGDTIVNYTRSAFVALLTFWSDFSYSKFLGIEVPTQCSYMDLDTTTPMYS